MSNARGSANQANAAGGSANPTMAGAITNPTTQRRQFFFTWNAPEGMNTPSWCENVSQILKNALDTHPALRAYQWEAEVGEQGHNHLQGCMFFKRDIRFRTLMDFLARNGVPNPNRIRFFTLIDVGGALDYTSKDFKAGKTTTFCSFRTD